jgi:sugar phosphate isomerase/epimerase
MTAAQSKFMYEIGIVSDETGLDDAGEAFRFGARFGVHRFELRCLYGGRVPRITAENRRSLKSAIRRYGVTITALSPGLFKCTLRDEELRDHAGAMLTQTLELAQELETENLITFGVRRDETDGADSFERVISLLGEAAYRAEKSGVTMCLENEPGWWADTPENLYTILRRLKSVSLKLNWDPGNLFATGVRDYRPGYRLLKNWIHNVHAKDAVADSLAPGGWRYTPLGRGDIDWEDQLRELTADGYGGTVSVETHCNPLSLNTARNIRFLRQNKERIS